ncbi:unnamed protein product, partial [Owenia fusiformis]
MTVMLREESISSPARIQHSYPKSGSGFAPRIHFSPLRTKNKPKAVRLQSSIKVTFINNTHGLSSPYAYFNTHSPSKLPTLIPSLYIEQDDELNKCKLINKLSKEQHQTALSFIMEQTDIINEARPAFAGSIDESSESLDGEYSNTDLASERKSKSKALETIKRQRGLTYEERQDVIDKIDKQEIIKTLQNADVPIINLNRMKVNSGDVHIGEGPLKLSKSETNYGIERVICDHLLKDKRPIPSIVEISLLSSDSEISENEEPGKQAPPASDNVPKNPVVSPTGNQPQCITKVVKKTLGSQIGHQQSKSDKCEIEETLVSQPSSHCKGPKQKLTMKTLQSIKQTKPEKTARLKKFRKKCKSNIDIQVADVAQFAQTGAKDDLCNTKVKKRMIKKKKVPPDDVSDKKQCAGLADSNETTMPIINKAINETENLLGEENLCDNTSTTITKVLKTKFDKRKSHQDNIQESSDEKVESAVSVEKMESEESIPPSVKELPNSCESLGIGAIVWGKVGKTNFWPGMIIDIG